MKQFNWNWDETTEWLPILDAYICSRLVEPDTNALEIGVWKGGWIFTIAENNLEVKLYGVDPYPNLLHVKNSFLIQVNQRALTDRVSLFESLSELRDSIESDCLFQLIHVDGEHTEEAVERDLDLPTVSEPESLLVRGCCSTTLL